MERITLDDVVSSFKGFSHYCFYVGNAIPENKKRNACISMGVTGQNPSVLALYDNTFWGGSRAGFVLAEDGLYARNSTIDPPIYCLWAEIKRLDCKGKYLVVNDHQIETLYFDDASRRKCCSGISSLVAKITGRLPFATDYVHCTQSKPS